MSETNITTFLQVAEPRQSHAVVSLNEKHFCNAVLHAIPKWMLTHVMCISTLGCHLFWMAPQCTKALHLPCICITTHNNALLCNMVSCFWKINLRVHFLVCCQPYQDARHGNKEVCIQPERAAWLWMCISSKIHPRLKYKYQWADLFKFIADEFTQRIYFCGSLTCKLPVMCRW